jgi:hypothetical protein
MSLSTASLQISDYGKYHKEIIQISLKREYGEGEAVDEVLFIKYGTRREPQICSVYYFAETPNIIFLSAAGTGSYGDIKLPTEVWFNALFWVRSTKRLDHWMNIFNKEKTVDA